MDSPARSPSKTRSWIAATLAVAALSLSIWIVVPGPTYFFLRLSVGAPEVSVWLIAASVIAGALAFMDTRHFIVSRMALLCALIAVCLAITPLARFAATARHFDAVMSLALGSDPSVGTRPNGVPFMRAKPLAIADLVRGVDIGEARITRGVPVAAPDGVPLTVDVYQPRAAGRYPIIVQIYGGAWQRGAPGANANAAQWLAAHDYVVFAIDYRHAPHARWPAQLDDVRTAMAWIREHAATYDADIERVAVIGRSAGAHLAMLAGYTTGALPIRAVVSYYGPVDLVDAYLHPPRPDPLRIRGVQDTLFGGTLDQKREEYRGASPIEYATRPLPPTLLVYAGRDHIVEPRYGARMNERLTKSGTKTVYLEIPWADHAFDEVFNGPSNQLALYHTERFLSWALDVRSDSAAR